MKSKVALLILDGWGLNKEYPGNAISLANTPCFDELWQNKPGAVLEASGESVGLPEGQMGTSEVNHFTIGAGLVQFQDLVRINKAIDDDSFFELPNLLKALDHAKSNNSTLHIVGLVSDGGVHSHLDHVKALVTAASNKAVSKVVVHVITDGRDTAPTSGIEFVQELDRHLTETSTGKIGTVIGRYYAMDRDNNWERTEQAIDLLLKQKGEQFASARDAIKSSYEHDITDEYITPKSIGNKQDHTLQNGDSIIIANFRNDRPRQLVTRLEQELDSSTLITTMTKYHPDYVYPVIFEPNSPSTSLSEILANAGKKQLKVTETEKYNHVTYFLNCKVDAAFEGEDRVMLDSYSDIPTHDLRPEMRAADIAQSIIDGMKNNSYDLIVANICNADMIGHTGNIEAAQKGCEAVDSALSSILPVAEKHGYTLLITADHGNADQMLNEETNELITSHTLNPVPLIVTSPEITELKRKNGTLIDIAPTILTLLGVTILDTMTGESFI